MAAKKHTASRKASAFIERRSAKTASASEVTQYGFGLLEPSEFTNLGPSKRTFDPFGPSGKRDPTIKIKVWTYADKQALKIRHGFGRDYVSLKHPIEVVGVSPVAKVEMLTPAKVGLSLGQPLQGEALQKVIRKIASLAQDILGPEAQGIEWLSNTKIPALNNETGAELARQGLGGAVVDYLNELRFGNRG